MTYYDVQEWFTPSTQLDPITIFMGIFGISLFVIAWLLKDYS